MTKKTDRLKTFLVVGTFVALFFGVIEASVQDGWRWSFQIPGHVEFELPDDC